MTNRNKVLPTLNYPAFLEKLRWVFDPIGYMESGAKQFRDLFVSRFAGSSKKRIFVHHPQAIQKILTNDRKKFFAPGKQSEILKPVVGTNSLFLLDGDRHKRERKLLMPPFHGERIKVYSQLICQLSEKVIKSLPMGKIFSARSAMQEISLQVILEVVFGIYDGAKSEELKQKIINFSDIFESPLTSAFLFFPWLQKDLGAWSPWSNFLHLREEIDKLIYQEIAERREQDLSDHNDILSLLMLARDEEGNPMTDAELRDELITILLAGHETTASALAWALYWILDTPEVEEKLLRELDSLGENPDPIAINRLPYLTAVCNESMRISPVVILTFPREVRESVELSGYKLEAGQIVQGCIYLIHHREDLYPEPKQFKPERFLEREYAAHEFVPFGGGTRRCLGYALAELELKLVIATIVSKYKLTLADNKPEKLARRGVTFSPSNGVKMIVTGERPTNIKRPSLVS